MILDIESSPMKQNLLLNKSMEESVTRKFVDVLERERQNRDGKLYVFEIGAHHGYYSLIAAKILGEDGDIFSIEPIPENAERVRQNRDLNEYTQIEVIEAAVSDKCGAITMSTNNRSYKNQALDSEANNENSLTVDAYTADHLFSHRNIPNDSLVVIRLDAEYHEKEVFKGMKDVLESDRPIIMFCEIHNSEGYGGVEIVEKLRQSGFVVECLDGGHICSDEVLNDNFEIFAMRV